MSGSGKMRLELAGKWRRTMTENRAGAVSHPGAVIHQELP
jgi:hypothetical protein